MSDIYIHSLDGYFSLRLQTMVIALKKMLKRVVVCWKGTNNAMAKRNRTKGQTMAYKILHRKL